MLYYVVTGVLFFWNSVQDIRHKTLHNGGLLVGAGAVLLLFLADGLFSGTGKEILLSERKVPWTNLWGVLPGAVVLFLSHLLKGSIGTGDGYLLCISGLALGLKQNVSLLFYALLFAGGVAVVLLVLKKVKRNTKMPFVPFLFAGFLLTLLQQHT